jgi:hypothetical protein
MAGRLVVSQVAMDDGLVCVPSPPIQHRAGPLLQVDSCHCMLARLASHSMCLLVALHDSHPTAVWITAS